MDDWRRHDELVTHALDLVERVREIDPERNRTWLLSLPIQDRFDLLFVLAAMVDPTATPNVLLGWTFPLEPR